MRPYAQAHVQQQVCEGLVLPTVGAGLFPEKRPASVLTVPGRPQLGKLIADFSPESGISLKSMEKALGLFFVLSWPRLPASPQPRNPGCRRAEQRGSALLSTPAGPRGRWAAAVLLELWASLDGRPGPQSVIWSLNVISGPRSHSQDFLLDFLHCLYEIA